MMKFLLYSLLTVSLALHIPEKNIDALVDVSIKGVEESMKNSVSKWVNKFNLPLESAKQSITEYVTKTFTDPTILELRSFLKNEITLVMQKPQKVDLIENIVSSLSSKIRKQVQSRAKDWTKAHITTKPRQSLSKRFLGDGEPFPHLFDNENSGWATLFSQIFFMCFSYPIWTMFGNDFQGNLLSWFVSSFLFNPIFNRLMFGYYLYADDKD